MKGTLTRGEPVKRTTAVTLQIKGCLENSDLENSDPPILENSDLKNSDPLQTTCGNLRRKKGWKLEYIFITVIIRYICTVSAFKITGKITTMFPVSSHDTNLLFMRINRLIGICKFLK